METYSVVAVKDLDGDWYIGMQFKDDVIYIEKLDLYLHTGDYKTVIELETNIEHEKSDTTI